VKSSMERTMILWVCHWLRKVKRLAHDDKVGHYWSGHDRWFVGSWSRIGREETRVCVQYKAWLWLSGMLMVKNNEVTVRRRKK